MIARRARPQARVRQAAQDVHGPERVLEEVAWLEREALLKPVLRDIALEHGADDRKIKAVPGQVKMIRIPGDGLGLRIPGLLASG